MDKEKKKINKAKKRFIKFLIKIFFITVFIVVGLKYFISIDIVHSNDMFPSLSDGQGVISYKLGNPKTGQLVLYYAEGKKRFGRIIAQDFDKVEITENGLSINGSMSYTKLPFPTEPYKKQKQSFDIPSNSSFILNDYRERTNDSRKFGPIDNNNIIGVVVFSVKYREF